MTSPLETRRDELCARLTRGYAWFVAHGYEPTTATGVDAVDGDRKAEKAEADELTLAAGHMPADLPADRLRRVLALVREATPEEATAALALVRASHGR